MVVVFVTSAPTIMETLEFSLNHQPSSGTLVRVDSSLHGNGHSAESDTNTTYGDERDEIHATAGAIYYEPAAEKELQIVQPCASVKKQLLNLKQTRPKKSQNPEIQSLPKTIYQDDPGTLVLARWSP